MTREIEQDLGNYQGKKDSTDVNPVDRDINPIPKPPSQPNNTGKMNDDTKKLVFERAAHYYGPGSDWWNEHPAEYFGTITSNMREDTHKKAATYTPMVQKWIDKQNELGGVPGVLIDARINALNIPDPVLRKNALDTIRAIQSMSEGNQLLFLTWARDPTAFAGATGSFAAKAQRAVNIGIEKTAGVVDTTQEITSGRAKGQQDTTPVGEINQDTGELQLSDAAQVAGVGDTDEVAQLYTLFPELRGKIHYDTAIVRRDIAHSIPGGGPIYEEGLNAYTAAQVFGTVAGAPLKAFGWANRRLAEHGFMITPAGPVYVGSTAATKVMDVAGAGVRHTENAMGYVAETWGEFTLDRVTDVTGHEFDPRTKALVGNIELAVALSLAGEGVSTVGKLTGGEVAESVAGELGIEDTYGSTVATSVEEAGLKGSVLHPVHTFLSPLVRKTAFDIFESIKDTSLENVVVNNSNFTNFYARVAKIVADSPDTETAVAEAMAASSNRLPLEYVQKLVEDGNPDHMGQISLDYIHDTERGNVDALVKARPALVENANRTKAELNRIESRPPDPEPATAEELADVHDYIASREKVDESTSEFINGASAKLATPTVQADRLADARAGTEIAHNIWKTDDGNGNVSYAYVDESGKVLAYNDVQANDATTLTVVHPDARGTGLATDFLTEVFKDKGWDSPGTFKGGIKGEALTPGGQSLLDKVADRLFSSDEPKLVDLNEYTTARDAALTAEAALKSHGAKMAEAVDKIKTQGPREPIRFFPTSRRLPQFLHRVWYAPRTTTEKIFRYILNPSSRIKTWVSGGHPIWDVVLKQGNVAKLVDKIENDAIFKFMDPTLSVATRKGILINNITNAERLFQRFGVPLSKSNRIKGLLINAGTPEEFADVVLNEIFGERGVLARYMPSKVSEEARAAVVGVNRELLDGGYGSVVRKTASGETYMEPVNPLEVSLPMAPNTYRLPSAAAIEDVLDSTRRIARNLRQSPSRSAQALGFTLDMSHAIFRMSTAIGKVPALFFNLPAIILTKMIDETTGNVMSPNLKSIFRNGSDKVKAATGPIPPEITGNSTAGFLDEGAPAASNRFLDVPTQDLLDNPRTAALVPHTIVAQVQQARSNLFLTKLAGFGGDVQKMVDWLRAERPEYAARLEDALNRGGDNLEGYIQRWQEYLGQITAGDQELVDFIAGGKIHSGNVGSIPEGPIVDIYKATTQELTDIRAHLDSLDHTDPANAATIRALETRLQDRVDQLLYINDEAQKRGISLTDLDKPNAKVPVDTVHPENLLFHVKTKLDNGELQLPDMMRIDTRAEEYGIGSGVPEMMNRWASKLSNAFYSKGGRISFKAIGRAEGRFARGNFYQQRAYQNARAYEALGMNRQDAMAMGILDATHMTKDMFYDLTARSTVERSLRNIFWFAPVNGELLYRWLYAIPAQSGGMIPGMALLGARATNLVNLFENMGVIKHDRESGQLVIGVGGLTSLLQRLSGGKLKFGDVQEIPLASLNPHLSGPIPSLSPIPGALVNKIAQHAPALMALADLVAPYQDVTFAPNAIRNAVAMLGIKLPDVSNEYINKTWNATHAQGYQLAFQKWAIEGNHPAPTEAQFGLDPNEANYDPSADTQPFRDAYRTWFDQLSVEAGHYTAGLYAAKLISSEIPGYVQSSTKAEQEFETFWKNEILPKTTPGTPLDNSLRARMDTWLGDHPDSLPYSITFNYYTGQTWTPSSDMSNEQFTRQLYAHGVKDTMNYEDYGRLMAAMSSRAAYNARLDSELNQIAPDGKASTMLSNWGDRSQAISNATQAWQNFLTTHPEENAILQTNEAKYLASNPSVEQKTIEATYVQQSLKYMKFLAPMFTGEGGVTSDEYNTVLAKLKTANASLYKDTGGNLTPMEQGITWYFDNVVTPYMDKTQPLYAKAEKYVAQGLDASDIYQKIDKVKNDYLSPTYQGESYPSIDAFFYGSKTKAAQGLAKLNWTTKPVSWLSDFQRSTLGYKSFTGEDQMWSDIQDMKDQYAPVLASLSPSSSQYKAIKTQETYAALGIAGQYGEDGIKAVQLDQADPYARLREAGFGEGNDSLQRLFTMADYIHGVLATDPNASSVEQKMWFYGSVYAAEQQDPALKALMERLSLASAPQHGSIHPKGVPLWDAIFFGNYNDGFIDQRLISAIPMGAV